MFRQTLARPLLRASSPVVNRSFSVAAVRMGAGDLGAPKTHGYQQEYARLFPIMMLPTELLRGLFGMV